LLQLQLFYCIIIINEVIKRDGRIVDYDRQKIEVAIEKANRDVTGKEKATQKEIKEIIDYIESLGKRRILVEDVQDIIEEKLMEIGKYKLAKEYIVYRYNRALVRKSNTTDESILGLIRNENKELAEENSNKNTMLASTNSSIVLPDNFPLYFSSICFLYLL
jgi:ribonucleoside-triphosphate reductase (formate)